MVECQTAVDKEFFKTNPCWTPVCHIREPKEGDAETPFCTDVLFM